MQIQRPPEYQLLRQKLNDLNTEVGQIIIPKLGFAPIEFKGEYRVLHVDVPMMTTKLTDTLGKQIGWEHIDSAGDCSLGDEVGSNGIRIWQFTPEEEEVAVIARLANDGELTIIADYL